MKGELLEQAGEAEELTVVDLAIQKTIDDAMGTMTMAHVGDEQTARALGKGSEAAAAALPGLMRLQKFASAEQVHKAQGRRGWWERGWLQWGRWGWWGRWGAANGSQYPTS